MSDGKALPLRSRELARRVVELARAGRSLRAISEELGLSYTALMAWQRQDDAFAGQVRNARNEAIAGGRRVAKGRGVTSRTDDKVAIVLKAIERGVGRTRAAAMAGVHAQTINRWLEQDEELERQVLAAEGRLAERGLAIIEAAAKHSWQAAAWLLERRLREDYALPRELPAADRQRMARNVGAGLADLLVKSLADVELPQEQQEVVRAKLVEALTKVAG